MLFSCKSLRALQVLTSRPGAIAALQTIINERPADGRSALHFAAVSKAFWPLRSIFLAVVHDAVAFTRVLLEEGADIHIKTPDGRTPRECAGDEIVALIKAYAI